MEWRSQHTEEIPNWASACTQMLLLQLSSAASERAFSLLQNSFNNRQEQALEDYIETSLILQYNNKLSRDSQLLSVLSLVDDFEDYVFLAVFMNLYTLLYVFVSVNS